MEKITAGRQSGASDDACEFVKRPRTAFLKRHILASDNHDFIGRIFDLGIVELHFDDYKDMILHGDIRYVMDVNWAVTLLTRRVESLNIAGDMIWPDPIPKASSLPIDEYQWLIASSDVFLMRFVSVVDCSLRLTNAVFEAGLPPPECKLRRLKQQGVKNCVLDILGAMLDEQVQIRAERNAIVHQGHEKEFTIDDLTFKTAAIFGGMHGIDRYGRKINVDRFFKEGLVSLQRQFNASTRKLVRQLDKLYKLLWDEFENRFRPKVRAATHGLNVGARQSAQ